MKHERHTLASFDNPALIAAKCLQTLDEKAAFRALMISRFASKGKEEGR